MNILTQTYFCKPGHEDSPDRWYTRMTACLEDYGEVVELTVQLQILKSEQVEDI